VRIRFSVFLFYFLFKKELLARNYQVLDKESTGGMIVPPGVTSSLMGNPQEK
jgi:hypothetical protein